MKNQTKKGVFAVLSLLTGVTVGAGIAGKIQGEKLLKMKEMSEKHLALFLMMNQWVHVKQKGKELTSYFEKKNYYRLAIYGMSYAGETLIAELAGSGIQVIYGIDQKAASLCADVEIKTMEDVLEEVDAVVVTSITFLEEIEAKLSQRMDCPIISLEDILYEV